MIFHRFQCIFGKQAFVGPTRSRIYAYSPGNRCRYKIQWARVFPWFRTRRPVNLRLSNLSPPIPCTRGNCDTCLHPRLSKFNKNCFKSFRFELDRKLTWHQNFLLMEKHFTDGNTLWMLQKLFFFRNFLICLFDLFQANHRFCTGNYCGDIKPFLLLLLWMCMYSHHFYR